MDQTCRFNYLRVSVSTGGVCVCIREWTTMDIEVQLYWQAKLRTKLTSVTLMKHRARTKNSSIGASGPLKHMPRWCYVLVFRVPQVFPVTDKYKLYAGFHIETLQSSRWETDSLLLYGCMCPQEFIQAGREPRKWHTPAPTQPWGRKPYIKSKQQKGEGGVNSQD